METEIIQLTELDNHFLISFANGDNIRILMPHLIRSVLRDLDYPTINQLLTFLSIKCCQCTAEQLSILHSANILSTDVNQCGLINKIDAKRLCKFIQSTDLNLIRPLSSTFAVPIVHYCFGQQQGYLYPELYVKANSRCIKCGSCFRVFSTCEFVKHTHIKVRHINTVHWGFHSFNWRYFINLYALNTDEEYHKVASVILDNIKLTFLKEENKKMKNRLPWRPKNLRINIPPFSITKHNSGFHDLKPTFKRKENLLTEDKVLSTPNVYIDPKFSGNTNFNKDITIDDDDDDEEDELPHQDAKYKSISNLPVEKIKIIQKINEYKRIISSAQKKRNYREIYSKKIFTKKMKPKYINSFILSKYQREEGGKIEQQVSDQNDKFEDTFYIQNQLHKSVFEKLNYLLQLTGRHRLRESAR